MKPILFNTEMTRAILDDRKTQTRRVAKIEFLSGFNPEWTGYKPVFEYGNFFLEGSNHMIATKQIKPRYKVGDILYVRETWAIDEDLPYGNYIYKADDENPIGWCVGYSWRPSIHMPKEAARIFLKVTGVRVERLQDIKFTDVMDEGILTDWDEPEGWENNDALAICGALQTVRKTTDKFRKLWDSTIKKSDLDRYGWNSNPWVWVYEFERCEKPEEDA